MSTDAADQANALDGVLLVQAPGANEEGQVWRGTPLFLFVEPCPCSDGCASFSVRPPCPLRCPFASPLSLPAASCALSAPCASLCASLCPTAPCAAPLPRPAPHPAPPPSAQGGGDDDDDNDDEDDDEDNDDDKEEMDDDEDEDDDDDDDDEDDEEEEEEMDDEEEDDEDDDDDDDDEDDEEEEMDDEEEEDEENDEESEAFPTTLCCAGCQMELPSDYRSQMCGPCQRGSSLGMLGWCREAAAHFSSEADGVTKRDTGHTAQCCSVCDGGDGEGLLLDCDACGRAFHTNGYCHPSIHSPPGNVWLCVSCD